MVGFTDLGTVNNQLKTFERAVSEGENGLHDVAHSMLVMMVRGLFSNLQFPYTQFSCTTLSGDQMFEPFWEAVGRLERCEFRVMGLVCDGLAANRRLFSLHGGSHKTLNPFTHEDRYIYFFSDPPHLLKTVRNAWCNPKRPLLVCIHELLLFKFTVACCSVMGRRLRGHI